MPDWDGFEVARALKQKPETREIPIIFLTGDSRAERRVEGLEMGAEDYITKPFHPPEVVARIKKALRAAARSKGLSGRLADLSLSSVVQFLELEQKSGTLVIFTKERQGAVHFRGGRIVAAVVGRHSGEKALYRLLGWTEGFFQFELGDPPVPPGAAITGGIQALLLEGARRLDELGRLRAALPPPGTHLVVSPRLGSLLQGRRLTPDLGRISTVAKGARRAKSPFRGKLDLFYLADFSFVRSRRSDLHILREVSLRDTHIPLRQEMPLLQQAAYCAALIEQATETETPLPAVYELMRGMLGHLPGQPPQPQTLFAFELRLLKELGLQPDVTTRKLTPGAKRITHALQQGDWSAMSRLRLSQNQVKELGQFLHGFLIFHLGRIPKGRPV